MKTPFHTKGFCALGISGIRETIIHVPLSFPSYLFIFGLQSFGLPVAMQTEPSNDEWHVKGPGEITNFSQLEEYLSHWIDSLSPEKRDFSFEDMLRQTCVSKALMTDYLSHLHKDFRTWKMEVKIEKVMSMLMHDDGLRVSEAAREMGFRDMSNFHRQFKKFVGSTPREWRYNNYYRKPR